MPGTCPLVPCSGRQAWNNGPPWHDLSGTLCCRCNISQSEDIELSPCKPACPGATALYQAIANASQWKCRLLSSNAWEPGLGQGSGPGNVDIKETMVFCWLRSQEEFCKYPNVPFPQTHYSTIPFFQWRSEAELSFIPRRGLSLQQCS